MIKKGDKVKVIYDGRPALYRELIGDVHFITSAGKARIIVKNIAGLELYNELFDIETKQAIGWNRKLTYKEE